MKNGMITRVIVGLALVGVFAAVWYFMGAVFYVALTLFSVLATYEVSALLKAKGYKPISLPSYIFCVIFPALYCFLDSIQFVLLAYVGMMFAVILIRVVRKELTNEDMLASLLLFLYPIMPFIMMMLLCTLEGYAAVAMISVFAFPLMGDTIAYFVGVCFGKHKLCPHISPKKTVAGSIGGFLGGVLGALLVYFSQYLMLELNMLSSPLMMTNLLPLCALGLVCSGIGQIGDLFASCLKRWADVKDFGTIFPGHGGIIDRMDSVLMCAPFIYLIFSIYTGIV